MKGVGGGGGSFEGVEELFEVDLDDAGGEVSTGDEGTAADAVLGEGMHDGCSKDEDGLFVETCGHGLNKGGGCKSEV